MKYQEALKLIHPDLNKNIINPAEKIILLKKYKTDPKKIDWLLSLWGIIDIPKEKKRSDEHSSDKWIEWKRKEHIAAKLLYKWLLKVVHPDYNKQISMYESSSRINTLNRHRRNLDRLIEISKEWGITLEDKDIWKYIHFEE